MKNIYLTALFFLIVIAARAQGGPGGPPSIADSVIHYWSFNGLSTFTQGQAFPAPDLSNVTGASLAYNPLATQTSVIWDTVGGTIQNALPGFPGGQAIRLRNPAGTFDLTLPTNGYKNIQFSYAVKRTSKGAQENRIAYSTDGITFSNTGLAAGGILSVDTSYKVVKMDLTSIAAASNNSNFKIRISFAVGDTNVKGNNRIDNIRLLGNLISGVENEFEAKSFSILANPVKTGETVRFSQPLTGTVYTSTGKAIAFINRENSFNTSGLGAGLYLIKSANGFSNKLIVE